MNRLKSILFILSVFFLNNVYSATFNFNTLYKGTGTSYTINTNSISNLISISGSNFQFYQDGSQFSGNSLNGILTYTNSSGNTITIYGNLNRRAKSGSVSESFYLRVFTAKKIILDIGWPMYDSTSIKSRRMKYRLEKIKHFLSFIASNAIGLETHAQLNKMRREMPLFKNRYFVSYTGFNELLVNKKSTGLTYSEKENFTILFRSKYNEESNFELVSDLSRILQNQCNFVILTNNKLPKNISFGESTKVIDQYLSWEMIQSF